MIEEGADEWSIEVVDVQLRGLDASPLGHEDEQQPQRVSIGGDGVWTDLALA
jgi:hypothetical protein